MTGSDWTNFSSIGVPVDIHLTVWLSIAHLATITRLAVVKLLLHMYTQVKFSHCTNIHCTRVQVDTSCRSQISIVHVSILAPVSLYKSFLHRCPQWHGWYYGFLNCSSVHVDSSHTVYCWSTCPRSLVSTVRIFVVHVCTVARVVLYKLLLCTCPLFMFTRAVVNK